MRVQLWTREVTATSQIGAKQLNNHGNMVCIFYIDIQRWHLKSKFYLKPFFLAATSFIIFSLADIQVGYEFRTPHSVLPYTLVANSTLRSFTKTTEVKRKVGPVGLLEAATAPCWTESSHSVEILSSKSSCKQSVIHFPKGAHLSRSPWQEEAN